MEMGDPVAVGVDMDRIHRPKMAWGLILLTPHRELSFQKKRARLALLS